MTTENNKHFLYDRRSNLPNMSPEESKRLIKEVVNEVLLSLGVDNNDHIEMQKDFQCLRDFRESTEKVKSIGLGTALTIAISGILAILWLGFKQSILGHN